MNKILIVDNEVEICGFVECFFKERMYSVGAAFDGCEALAQIRNFKPDVVLLDLLMPVMDGVMTLAEAKMIDYRLKVIMITAVDEEEVIKELMKYKNVYYLHKPIKLCESENKVKESVCV